MKGVVVQIGEPKSIVLFNNGKIRAIPTPADCHVGMVVAVKLNDKLKIIVIALAALFLLAMGIIIGTALHGKNQIVNFGMGPGMGMGASGSGNNRRNAAVTVAEAKNMPDDTTVLLVGKIVQSLGDEKYTFRDATGDITVEIERRMCRNMTFNEFDTMEISGEVDIDHGQARIDAKSVRKL